MAAETNDLAEKERCLEAIVELDLSQEWAQVALRGVQYRRLGMNWGNPRVEIGGKDL